MAEKPRRPQSLGPDPHRERFDLEEKSVTVSILEAIAVTKGKQVGELDFRLYDYLDPEALDDLVNHSHRRDQGTWKFDFSVDDVRITLHSDGHVVVY